jgi:hypothetical protein
MGALMSYIVLEIKDDGRIIKTIQPKAPTYEQQRKAVGGYIETIPYFTNVMHEGVVYNRGTAYADEEGHLKQKRLNVNATAMWRFSCPGADFSRMDLCGDVIFFAKVKD